ncbi:MAG: hypothetical protein KDD36_04400 [Flavobacteriales bacterium]|nr:hypothetical protein [Flavobacteriales bacterium]
MNLFEFFKELYFKENDRKLELQNALNIPIITVTAIVSILFYFVTTFSYGKDSYCLNAIFVILSIGTALVLLFSIIHITRSYTGIWTGYDYSYVAGAKKLQDWYGDLMQYYNERNGTISDINEAFKQGVLNKFTESIDKNRLINDLKFKYLFRAKQGLVIAVYLTMATSIVYLSNFFQAPNESHNSEIMTPEEDQQNGGSQDSKPVEPPPPPPPPPNEIQTEGAEPVAPRPTPQPERTKED